MSSMMMGGMGLWMLGWVVLTLAVLAAIAAAGIWLGRRATPDQNPAAKILMRRYAEGEIDEDDYQRRLAGLNH